MPPPSCTPGSAPQALLELMLEVEKSFGRVRTVKWGPRSLDLDILFYEDIQLDLPGLKVPHPLMSERLFVLAPLAEIEPDWVHPALGLTVHEMLDRILELDHQQEIHKAGKVKWDVFFLRPVGVDSLFSRKKDREGVFCALQCAGTIRPRLPKPNSFAILNAAPIS